MVCSAWSGGEPPRPVSCTGRWDGAAVSVEARIIAFLSRRRGQLFCDDCLRRELQLTQHAAVERATEAVGAAVGFRRATETCARCARSRSGPNPADPHRNDRPTGNAGPALLSRKRPDCGNTLTFHTARYAAPCVRLVALRPVDDDIGYGDQTAAAARRGHLSGRPTISSD
jgi:hypothetical protein